MFHSNAAAQARRTPLLIALVALAMIAVALVAPSADAAASKSLMCHVEGNGTAHVVAVSDAAVEAHLAHGDATVSTGSAGDECSPNAAPIASYWYYDTLWQVNNFNLMSRVTDDGPSPYTFFIVPGSPSAGLTVTNQGAGWVLTDGFGTFDWYVCDGLGACSNTARVTIYR